MKKTKTIEDALAGVEKNTCIADTEFMLRNAEQHIQKLKHELKEKEFTIVEQEKQCKFYEQLIKNLTTFK